MNPEDTLYRSKHLAARDKVILVGLYLSKFDSVGLKWLGFETFAEAFNVMGYALGSKPASVKNYRDEFDPLFPNPRKGWHKRKIRDHCLKVFQKYGNLDLEPFADLIKSIVTLDDSTWSEVQQTTESGDGESYFAKRLITGRAAEKYFESVHAGLSEFEGYVLENTTHLGCGYDFRLLSKGENDFLAVEVKGLKERTGNLSMTPKEHDVATSLRDRFFLFVVKNFQESPFHEIFQDPLAGRLQFRKTERLIVQVTWSANV